MRVEVRDMTDCDDGQAICVIVHMTGLVYELDVFDGISGTGAKLTEVQSHRSVKLEPRP